MQKKYFQGIRDRFIRDPEFRNRMIESNRDEELCRRWDALADEDHTHHLTSREYSLYQGDWWLHSNKQGSNTVPVTHRPDFKQALSTLQQLKQKAEGASQAPTYSHRNQQWAQSSSSWWNWQGSWWTIVNEVILRDRSEQLVVIPQRGSKATAIYRWKR